MVTEPCYTLPEKLAVGRGQKLLQGTKAAGGEALYIQMTPLNKCFNRDEGLKVTGCWTAVMRKQEGRLRCIKAWEFCQRSYKNTKLLIDAKGILLFVCNLVTMFYASCLISLMTESHAHTN